MQILILNTTLKDIDLAIGLLAAGRCVAFPTETVYGLGADAHNDAAVELIYRLKGRPSFNPLILHVSDLVMAKRYGVFNACALRLARAFWPGALSLVVLMRANNGLSHLVTAGLAKIAIRVPSHPVAQTLLRRFDKPLAAPSANLSGKITATTAAHVVNDLGHVLDAVLVVTLCAKNPFAF